MTEADGAAGAEGQNGALSGSAETPVGPAGRGALHFTAVEMVKTPGFPKGLPAVENLSPGINLIFGPNGAGKTTMARCLINLLWPETAPRDTEVYGRFTAGESSWHVEASRGRGRWQRDGADASAGPVTVKASEADRYYLSLTELLQAEESGSRFAHYIEKETAGGYDMVAMRQKFKTRWHVSGHRLAAGRLKKARAEKDKALQKMMALGEKEQELERKLRERDRAREAGKRALLMEAARKALEARREHARLEEALAAFPLWMDKLSGNEGDRLKEMDGLLTDWDSDARAAEGRIKAAEAEMAASGLPDGGLEPGVLEAWRERLADLRRLEEEAEGYRPRLAEAREAAADIESSLGGTVNPDAMRPIGRREIDELAALSRRVRDWAAREQALSARAAALEEQVTPTEIDENVIHHGIAALSRWLRQPGDDARGPDPVLGGAGMAAAGAMVAAGAVMMAAGITGLGIAFAALGLVLGGFIFVRGRGGGAGPARDGRRREQEEFLRLGVEPAPREWSEEGVALAMAELEAAWRQAAAVRGTENRLRELHPELSEARRNLADARSRWSEYTRELGLPADADPESVNVLASTIKEWQQARRRQASLATALDEAEKAMAEKLASLNEQFAALHMPPAEDRARAVGIYEQIREKAEKWERARGEITAARASLSHIADNAERTRGERRTIFTRLGLDPDEAKSEAALYEALGRLREFRKLQQDYYAAEREAAHRLGDLRAAGGGEAELALGEEALKEAEEQASREAGQVEHIVRRIGEISHALSQAKKGSTVEKALAAVEDEETELRDLYHQGLRLKLGEMLADALIAKTRQEERPRVFYRARELFHTFTEGAYKLTMDDDGHTFRAVEERTGGGRALDELSDATKVQLLMAVRMAFVEQYENGTKLPIIFDEVLATSDDGRARALMGTVAALAAQGRQVFYFTAQQEEIRRWRTLLDGSRAAWTYVALGKNEGNGGADAYD